MDWHKRTACLPIASACPAGEPLLARYRTPGRQDYGTVICGGGVCMGIKSNQHILAVEMQNRYEDLKCILLLNVVTDLSGFFSSSTKKFKLNLLTINSMTQVQFTVIVSYSLLLRSRWCITVTST